MVPANEIQPSQLWDSQTAFPEIVAANSLALKKLFETGRIDADICWTVALAAASAARVPRMISLLGDIAGARFGPEIKAEAAAAIAWMSFTNTYYRYTEGIHGDGYEKIAPVFRRKDKPRSGRALMMHELACLGISAINGCKLCTGVHREYAMKSGATDEMCRDAVEIAAHVNAIALSQLIDANC